MLTRTTSSQMSASLVNYMASTQGKFNKLTTQLTTKKKINSITDDAVAAKSILSAKREINVYNGYINNMKTAQFELNAVDDAMKASETQASRAKDIAMMAANGTYSQTELNAFKQEVDGIIQTMTGLANTEYGDTYLFSGTASLQKPFSSENSPAQTLTKNNDDSYTKTVADADGNVKKYTMTKDATTGTWTTTDEAGNSWATTEADWTIENSVKINYNGTDEERKILIGEGGLEEQIGIIGSDIYGKGTVTTKSVFNPDTGETTSTVEMPEGQGGILASLYQLSAALDAGDMDAVRSSMDGITQGVDTLAENKAISGVASNRFDTLINAYDDTVTNLTSLRSSLEDADISALVTDWMQSQYALQASYSISSQLMNISIMNYI